MINNIKFMEENMKKIIISIISIIAIVLIIFLAIVIFFMYHLFGDDITKIDNITENEKREMISLMNLDDYYDEISLEKIAVPLTYRDIYYKIYFKCSTDIDIDNIETNPNSDLDLDFVKIKDNQYICTVSNMEKQVDLLEEIRAIYHINKHYGRYCNEKEKYHYSICNSNYHIDHIVMV